MPRRRNPGATHAWKWWLAPAVADPGDRPGRRTGRAADLGQHYVFAGIEALDVGLLGT